MSNIKTKKFMQRTLHSVFLLRDAYCLKLLNLSLIILYFFVMYLISCSKRQCRFTILSMFLSYWSVFLSRLLIHHFTKSFKVVFFYIAALKSENPVHKTSPRPINKQINTHSLKLACFLYFI